MASIAVTLVLLTLQAAPKLHAEPISRLSSVESLY